MLFFGDNHGGEAVVGHRDACCASGRSAVTNSLLLSVFGRWERLVLIGMSSTGAESRSAGVGNSTIYWMEVFQFSS